jgi:hypothetical protein
MSRCSAGAVGRRLHPQPRKPFAGIAFMTLSECVVLAVCGVGCQAGG